MRTKIYLIVVLIGLVAFSIPSVAKDKKGKAKTFTNTVVDIKGNGIPGVAVVVNEGAIKTTTDETGRFSVKTTDNAVFLFEAIGYKNRILSASEVAESLNGIVLEIANVDKVSELVNLPYETRMQRYRTTGNIAVIDAEEAFETDARLGLGTAITNKVPGVIGASNIHGFGAGVYVIDGVVRDEADVLLTEVEQITILKDPISRMIYGADGDKGVVMITTKNGKPYRKDLRITASYSMKDAISYPRYLNSADYMRTYNQAFLNDGGDPASLPYSTDMIAATEAGTDPVLYPDLDYYSSEFVKNSTMATNVFGEASGGNQKVQYLLNFMWNRNDGWLKQGANIRDNNLRTRGKVSAEIFNWLHARSEISARFNINQGANIGAGNNDYWGKSTRYLPNVYPLLIPKDRVANLDEITGERFVNGDYLLGGTSIYSGNIIGDLSLKGDQTQIDRWLTFINGLDFDLSGITKGLKATAQMSYQFFNSYREVVENSYAVYEPQRDASGLIAVDENNQITVKQIGVDKVTTSRSVNEKDMDFNRRLDGYLSLNYQRTFGAHDVNATLVGYQSKLVRNDVNQDVKRVAVGGNLNYMYNDRYVVELGGLMQGSNKMSPGDRFGFAPTVGASWIVSNEDFFNKNSFVNYLKLRGSYGLIENDDFKENLGDYNGYFLYEQIYKQGNSYWYGNGGYVNKEMLISSVANKYSWQKRKEFVLGADAYLFNNSTWFEATYFNSKVYDILVQLSEVPGTMGGVPTIGNHDAYRKTGFELGLEHKQQLGQINLQLGLNYMYLDSKVLKDDAVVEVEHLNKEGNPTDAIYAYEADGFYLPEDFNADGSLKEGLPVPAFGAVQPGDIKYVDYYEDGIINANDQHKIGNSGNKHYAGLNFKLSYKNWSIFATGSAAFGGIGFTNSSYYWFKGNKAKYSEMALLAYTPDENGVNTNPEAIYPRLTLGKGSNNYQKSTFWTYHKDVFRLNYVQAAYNFTLKPNPLIKDLKLYLSGSNLLTVARDAQTRRMMELNVGKAPSARTYTLGLIANF